MRTIYHNWLLDELSACFGEAAVDKLMAHYASQRIYIPKTATGQLLETLGPEVLKFLVSKRAATTLDVPSVRAVEKRRRVSAMQNDIRLSEDSPAILAKRHGVTRRHVFSIRAHLRAHDPLKRKRK